MVPQDRRVQRSVVGPSIVGTQWVLTTPSTVSTLQCWLLMCLAKGCKIITRKTGSKYGVHTAINGINLAMNSIQCLGSFQNRQWIFGMKWILCSLEQSLQNVLYVLNLNIFYLIGQKTRIYSVLELMEIKLTKQIATKSVWGKPAVGRPIKSDSESTTLQDYYSFTLTKIFLDVQLFFL